AAGAVIFGTVFGGAKWSEAGSSRFPTQPTYSRANRLAAPDVPDPMVAANNLAVAGLAGSNTDGVIYLAAAPIL
ncbi:hypothetical protein SE17_41640, partial [Kouleothrix aurantiaca]